MADYTATTDLTLEQCITNGPMVDGDNLTINSGAVVTCDRTPSILMGNITINDGELFIDGENIGTGNMINFVGEQGQEIIVNGQGVLDVNGDWYTLGTTNGTDSQTFNLTTYYDSSFCVDHVPMIQVETGRRIDFDNASGTTPEVDDFVYKATDKGVFGRIVEVNATSSYLVVKYLIGSLANDDGIEVRKVVDNVGPDLQISWTADVNNVSGDIKEAGIYQEFGNSRANGVTYISSFGNGIGGFVFDNPWQSTTLTMGSSTGGGFVPPSGCTVRVPNVHFSNATTTAYASNNTSHPGTDVVTALYSLDTGLAGTIELDVCNVGTAYMASGDAFSYTANFVGTHTCMGSQRVNNVANYTSCCVVSDPIGEMEGPQEQSFATEDIINGVNIIDCLRVKSLTTRDYIGGNATFNINVSGCIATGAFAATGPSSSFVYAYTFEQCNNITFNNNIAVMADTGLSFGACRLLNCDGFESNDFKVQTVQDGTPQTEEEDCMIFNTCSNIRIVGTEFLNDSLPGRNWFVFTDSREVKIRAVGMIDDKYDRALESGYIVSMGGYMQNLDLARCWTTGGNPNEIILISDASTGISVKNCSGDYNGELEPAGGNDVLFAGTHGGNGTPGSATGVGVTYPSKYGRQIHDHFRSDTVGNIYCLMITPSETVNNVTITAGAPKFFKDGDLDMVSGDVIEFEQDYFALGHTGFTGNFTTAIGGASWGADEWTNVTVDFQYDINDGSGWNGTWLDLRTSSNLTGISVDPGDGVKLKFRLTATGTQTSMSGVFVETSTTISDQNSNLYPIDQNEVSITINTLDGNDGSDLQDVRVLMEADAGGDLTQGTDILSGLTDANGEISRTDFVYTSDQPVTIKLRKATTSPYFKPQDLSGTITSTGFSLTSRMIRD